MSNTSTPKTEEAYDGEERRRQFDTGEKEFSADMEAYDQAAKVHHERSPHLPPLTLKQFFQREEDDLVEINKHVGDRAKAAVRAQVQNQVQNTVVERDTSEVESKLAELSERFISVDAMNKALKSLKGVDVEIPEDEIARLKGLLPAELTAEHREAIEKLRKASEGNAAPLMMQLPGKVMVDGEEKSFTIATMQEIMRKAKEVGSLAKPLWLSSYVAQATKDQEWDSNLGVWTSTCLKYSKDKSYWGTNGQLEHQKTVLGEGHEIHADMILAMAIRYIHSGEEFMRNDFMRLNDTDSVGDPLDVAVDDDVLYLADSDGNADSDGGVGGSLRIS